MSQHPYVFAEAAHQREYDRLREVEAVNDPVTFGHLKRLDVTEGWHCLEVGAGAGSVMRWLCDRVGQSGHVLAVDIDPKFVVNESRPNLTVRQMDVVTEELGEAEFDLIHARYVLMHIKPRDEVIPKLHRALKPGGWLLLEDPDFDHCCAATDERQTAEAMNAVFQATHDVYTSMGIDPHFGRKLPERLQRAKFREIDAAIVAGIARGTSPRANIWRMAVDHLRDALLNTNAVTVGQIEHFLRAMTNPHVWFHDYTTISVWGRR